MTIVLFALAIALGGQLQQDEPFTTDVRARLLQATVRIVQETSSPSSNVGTGVLVRLRGDTGVAYILTAEHVVDGPGDIEVHTFSLEEFPSAARCFKTGVEVVATDERADLALLRVVTDNLLAAALPICPIGSFPKRFSALACGCSLTEPPLLWTTSIESSSIVKGDGVRARFWISGVREPFDGESGGPLIDRRGRVIGICSMGGQKKGMFCHMREIHQFLKRSGF